MSFFNKKLDYIGVFCLNLTLSGFLQALKPFYIYMENIYRVEERTITFPSLTYLGKFGGENND